MKVLRRRVARRTGAHRERAMMYEDEEPLSSPFDPILVLSTHDVNLKYDVTRAPMQTVIDK